MFPIEVTIREYIKYIFIPFESLMLVPLFRKLFVLEFVHSWAKWIVFWVYIGTVLSKLKWLYFMYLSMIFLYCILHCFVSFNGCCCFLRRCNCFFFRLNFLFFQFSICWWTTSYFFLLLFVVFTSNFFVKHANYKESDFLQWRFAIAEAAFLSVVIFCPKSLMYFQNI